MRLTSEAGAAALCEQMELHPIEAEWRRFRSSEHGEILRKSFGLIRLSACRVPVLCKFLWQDDGQPRPTRLISCIPPTLSAA
jgi:hypothetical protein